jgi:phosphate transport system protein
MSGPRHFHEELSKLKDRLLDMSGRVVDSVDLAMRAIHQGDPALADKVIQQDREIDLLEVDIENTVTSLLALQQPMAKDLRLLLATLKISNDLERVGDHGVNIAGSAKRLPRTRSFQLPPELNEMTRRAREMLSDVLSAFVRSDAKAAYDVCRRDDEVDALHRSLFRILLTHMAEDPHTISSAIELFLVSRNLERVADLATNIGEDVIFLVEGKSIKHTMGRDDPAETPA